MMKSSNTNPLKVDAIVVGMGIMGLMLAKRLLDFGQTVAIIDRSSTIAKGSSVKNHGWIHQGTTHSLSADTLEQAKATVKRLQYGHAFYKSYAPEVFEEPSASMYAVSNDANRAAFARERWTQAGVPFREMTAEEFRAVEPGLNPAAAKYFFEVADSSINNRLLLMKLLTDIRAKGAVILTGAEYEYDDDYQIRVTSLQGERVLRSPLFFYAAGAGTAKAYEKLTGEEAHVRCYKSHMLFLPRVSKVSVYGMDYSNAVVINHGDVSAVNRAHDTILSTDAEPQIDPEEIERSRDELIKMFPSAALIPREAIKSVACLKPSLYIPGLKDNISIESNVSEPVYGHIFALPGKMTAAPYVADNIIRELSSRLDMQSVTPRPFDDPFKTIGTPKTKSSRPVRRKTVAPKILAK
jgi:glycine/D-amino acid oxidase-like deaminating enzyme